VVLAAAAIAATFAILARHVSRRLDESTTLVFCRRGAGADPAASSGAPACARHAGHDAVDRRLDRCGRPRGAPSFWLLPLIALWANLHGGFVFGLFLVAPIALDALLNAEPPSRKALAFTLGSVRRCRADRLLLYALWLERAAGLAQDSQPRQRAATDLGMAAGGFRQYWHPRMTLLTGIGLALYRGVQLPPMRIALLLGLLHMALSQSRAAEMLALVAPLVLAEPLARQIGGTDMSASGKQPPLRGGLVAGFVVALVAGTVALCVGQAL